MLTLKVEIEGRNSGDLDLAIQEMHRRIQQGNTSGFDSNDSGSFQFSITGEEEEPADD